MVKIESNGSKWLGEQPDEIEALIERLGKHALDPSFEAYGNFVQRDPHGAKHGGYDPETGRTVYIDTGPLYPPGTVDFWGNFAELSAVFKIVTDEPEVIAKLSAAIRANQQSEAYLAAKKAENGRFFKSETYRSTRG